MDGYYRINNVKWTFADCWRLTRSPKVLLFWLCKIFRYRLPVVIAATPGIESYRDCRIEETELPADAAAKLGPRIAFLKRLGFSAPEYYRFPILSATLELYSTTLGDASGVAAGHLIYTRDSQFNPPREGLSFECVTEFEDGSFLFSTTSRLNAAPPPNVTELVCPNAPLDRLWEEHKRGLERLRNKNIRRLRLPEDAWEAYGRKEKVFQDYKIRTGCYERMSDAEVAALQAKSDRVRGARQAGVENAEILAELDPAPGSAGSAGWGRAVGILVFSIILFLALGAARWTWQYALMLIPILFFHESGHYLAMRLFRYRNLRMFFIPLFGAVVVGQSYNVPGWKKVIVSLAGPLPGIIVGTFLGLAGIAFHIAILLKIALVAIIINGFNLLPIMPLDGGWIAHALFFCRNLTLDVAFRAIAGVALIVGGPKTGNPILLYVGILTLWTLPTRVRLMRIANTLTQRALPASPPDDKTIPTENAQAIIAEVRKSFGPKQTNRMVAQRTLEIFETLNARPPGWLATAGFSLVYLGSLAVAALFTIVFVGFQHGTFAGLAAGPLPRYSYKCASTLRWPPGDAPPARGAENIIVSTFHNESLALAAFGSVTNAPQAGVRAEKFGESVLVAYPAGADDIRKAYLSLLRTQTTNVFVVSTNFRCAVSCRAIAPDRTVASNIVDEARLYLEGAARAPMMPPWSSEYPTDPAQRSQWLLARRTFSRLADTAGAVFEDADVKSLTARLLQAQSQGDRTQGAELQKQIDLATVRASQLAVQKLREEGPEKMDFQLLDLYGVAGWGDLATNVAVRRLVSARLGAASTNNIEATSALDPNNFEMGVFQTFGTTVRVSTMTFRDLFDDLPAMADWFCAKGCERLRYEISGISAPDDDP